MSRDRQDQTLHNKGSLVRTIREGFITVGLVSAAVVALLPLIAVLHEVLSRGAKFISLDLFLKTPPAPGMTGGGVGNALMGTVLVVGLATLLSVPIGVFSAIYLSELEKNKRLVEGVMFGVNTLAGVPSIIAGIFAYGLLISTHIVGFSIIAGAVALSVVMLPVIVRASMEALSMVPEDIRWGALGVGAYPFQMVLSLVIPTALPGILTGVMLAVARAAGETAPLIMTVLFSNFWVTSVTGPAPTLSVLIYNFSSMPFKAQQDMAWAAALVLLGMVLTTNIAARLTMLKR